jgi:hypothetical protein
MAILKMGALVTEIVGSLGGNAFKRQRGTQVMFKKSNGASKAKVLINKNLSSISVIFKSWSLLSAETKAAWGNEATKYQFPNKFGDMVNLTGVQLQRKLQLQNYPRSPGEINPSGMNSNLKDFSINETTINWGTFDFNLIITTDYYDIETAIMVEFSNTSLRAPSFVRRGIFTIRKLNTGENNNLYGDLIAKYPFLDSNYNLRIYIYEINEYGFVSVQQTLDVTDIT